MKQLFGKMLRAAQSANSALPKRNETMQSIPVNRTK